jgi:hypothetical protein
MYRSIKEDSNKIYFIIFQVLLYFLQILEIYLIYRNLKEMKTRKNSRTMLGRHFTQSPALLAWPNGSFILASSS